MKSNFYRSLIILAFGLISSAAIAQTNLDAPLGLYTNSITLDDDTASAFTQLRLPDGTTGGPDIPDAPSFSTSFQGTTNNPSSAIFSWARDRCPLILLNRKAKYLFFLE